jgi:hypothetical protein
MSRSRRPGDGTPPDGNPDDATPDDGTQPAGPQGTPPVGSSGEVTEPSAIDDIFHESQFAEVDDAPLIPAAPARRAREPREPREPRRPREPREPREPNETSEQREPGAGWEFTRQQRLLLWIAGGALAIIVLLILFLVGIKTAPNTVSAPVTTPSPSVTVTPTITPTPTVAATGPAAAGVHKWTELRGGECLQPYESPWAESFTVVDCATPHAAQLVYRAAFPGAEAAAGTVAYPGAAALQAQINLLCTAPGVIDLTAAGAYTDVQFQASYAATSQEWTKGNHDYSCFVSRSSGEPIAATLATVH